jgi:hypothetical protein
MKATEDEFEQGKTFNICGPLATLSLQTNLRINQSFMNNRETTFSKVLESLLPLPFTQFLWGCSDQLS